MSDEMVANTSTGPAARRMSSSFMPHIYVRRRKASSHKN
jgi:hypothetical protein